MFVILFVFDVSVYVKVLVIENVGVKWYVVSVL